MKHTRSIIGAFALVLGCTATAVAQNPQPTPAPAQPQGMGMGAGMGGGQGMAGRMRQMLLNGITLTPAQQAQVDSIDAGFQAQRQTVMDSIRTAGGGDRDAMRARMQGMMQGYTQQLRAVLTADQQVTLDHNIADMEARRRQMQQGAGGPPPAR